MASDAGVGDVETARLWVAPADGTTQVVLTVRAPDGTTSTVPMTGADPEPISDSTEFRQLWTSDTPVTYTAAGRWVLHYAVTGTGEGAEDYVVQVVTSPVAGGPTWTPGRSRVAAYIPKRTLVRDLTSGLESDDVYLHSFDDSTDPSGTAIDQLIADGVAWVSMRVPNVADSLSAGAAVIATIFAAAMAERSWPSDDQSLQRANDLERRLDVLLGDLAAAQEASSGTGDYGIDIAGPVYSFPLADLRYDYPTYW